jgi:membrane-associated phospholipid phosphatase
VTAGHVMGHTSAADRLALFVLAVFAVLVIVHREPLYLLGLVTLLAMALLSVATWAQHDRLGEILHALGSPYLAVGGTFELLGPIIAHATPARWDAYLAALDVRWLGWLVDAWQGALGRPAWLIDAMSLAYVSFYAVPLAVGIGVYLRRPREFDRYALATEAAFFIPYVGYLLMPAIGPRKAFEGGVEMGGTAIGAAARAFIRAVELNVTDAFPSGHTSVLLVVLAFGWRLLPRWRVPLTIVVASIIFSTVYLSYHYAVDILAGALVALAMPLFAPLARAFTPYAVQQAS